MQTGKDLEFLIKEKGFQLQFVAKKMQIDRITLHRILKKEKIDDHVTNQILDILKNYSNDDEFYQEHKNLKEQYKMLLTENRILKEKLKLCTDTVTGQALRKSYRKDTV